jgi:hypothetical protein
MSPTMKRVLSITSIILCGLVILLLVAGILGIWTSTGKIITAGTNLISAAEKGVAALQSGIASVDRQLDSLEQDTQTIQDATAQLSQNISDKGLVMVLLPPDKEEKLTNTVSTIKDTLTTAEQTLSSVLDTLTFIDSLPFISIPKPDPETVSAAAAKVEQLNTAIDNTRATMQQARDNSAGAAQKVSDTTGQINDAITAVRAELDARSQKLTTTQDSLTSYKQSLSLWVYLAALLVTLIFGWIIYTQILIIKYALQKYKAA